MPFAQMTPKPSARVTGAQVAFAALGAVLGALGLVTLEYLAIIVFAERLAAGAAQYGLSGYLFLVSVLPFAATGGVVGGFAAWRLGEPGQRLATRPLSALLLLVFAVPTVWVACELVIAAPSEEASYLAPKEAIWLNELSRGGLKEEHAVDLAERLVVCTRTRGALIDLGDLRGSPDCGLLLDEHVATPAPRIPCWPQGDRGWRWRLVGEGPSWRIQIEAVEVARLEGPVFEITSELRLLRRQTKTSVPEEISLPSR
jgi:hypothetical protein